MSIQVKPSLYRYKTVALMAQNHLPPNFPSISPGSTAVGYGLGVSVTLDSAFIERVSNLVYQALID